MVDPQPPEVPIASADPEGGNRTAPCGPGVSDRPASSDRRREPRQARCTDVLGAALALLLAVFAIAPLAYPGFPLTQNGFLAPYNVENLSASPDYGRATDPVRGEGMLPYLLAQPFRLLTGRGTTSVKWGYALAFLVGALAVYAWARRWLGVEGSVLAAVIYTYLPWHLSTVYVRGAYGEAWLWALAPLVPWAADRMKGSRKLAPPLVLLLAVAAMFLVQPGLAALFLLPAAAYFTFLVLPRRRLPWGAAALALVAAFVVLLARIVPGDQRASADGLLYPFQLFSAAWEPTAALPAADSTGAGLISPGRVTFQLGVAAVGLTIVALALWAGGKGSGETNGTEPPEGNPAGATASPLPLGPALGFWLALLGVVVLLTLRLAAPFWRLTGLDALLTAPWQLLAFAGLPLAFLAGSVARQDRRLAGLPLWAGLIALTILASYPYLAPRFTAVDPGARPVALFQAGEPARPQITLLDADVEPASEITPTVVLTLTWQALGPVDEEYTVFVHLLAGDDRKLAQGDALPCGGKCPTSTWQPGELAVDRYELSAPAEALSGPYRLAVGLYRLDTGERLAVAGRQDGTVYVDVP